MATKSALLAVLLLVFSLQIFGQTPPPTPTGLQITATECGKISLAWDGYQSGTTVTSYDIYRTYGSEFNSYYKIVTISESTLNFVDNFNYSSSGQNYYYKIKGVNGSAESDFSNTVFSSFSCPIPTNLVVTNTTCGKIDLAWTDLPAESNNNGYSIYYSYNGENGYYYSAGTVGKNVTSYSFQGYDIRSGIMHFKIIGIFGGGNTSDYSNVAATSIISCPIPTGTTVTSSSCGAINISWNDYPSEILETGFTISRSDSELGSYYSVGYVGANVTNYTDVSYMEPNTTYYYRVSGRFFSTVSFLSGYASGSFSCQAPTGLQFESSKCGEITINWEDYPSEFQETGYTIYRSETEDGNYYSLTTVNANVLSFTDKNSYSLAPNTVYYYKVAGRFNNTTTQLSNFISGSFSCQVPNGLRVASSECGSITLNWDDYPVGQNETSYTLYRSDSPNGYFSNIATINANILTYTDTYLSQPGTNYYYKLKGRFNNTDTDFGNIVNSSFTCTIPTGLQVESASCGKINLKWNDYPSGTNETGYVIYYSDSENGYYNQIGTVPANTLTYSFSSSLYGNTLMQNQNYYFKIQGKFNYANTNFSQAAVGSFTCSSPPNPQFTASSCGSITISWADFPSGVNENGFEIYRSDNEFGYYSNIGSVASDILTYEDKGYIQPGYTYYYKIKGLFFSSSTYFSAPTSGTFSCPLPNSPTATAVSCGHVNVSWADFPSSTNETGFTIYRMNGNNGYFSQIASVAANVFNYEDKSYNLNPNTNYYYKIAGTFNSTSTVLSEQSNSVSFTCAVPTGLQISSSSCGKINLSWSDYPSGIDETGFIISRGSTLGGYFSEIGQVNANITSYIDNSYGLVEGQTYYYRIKGKFNNTNSGESDTVNGSFVCNIPNGLQLVSSTCGSIIISWTDYPSGVSENGYDIFRSTSENGVYNNISNVNANVLSYTDNSYDLPSGVTYYYKIRGRFNNSYSGYSSTVTAIFNCEIPTGLVVSSTSCGKIKLNWNSFPVGTVASTYSIYRATSETGNYSLISSFSNNNFTYTDDYYLTSGITYFYKIKARFNSALSDFSNIASGSFSCSVPTGLAISNTSCGSISISWTDYPSNVVESGYYIYRSTSLNGTYSQISSTNANVLTFSDNNSLVNGQTYYYKIVGRFVNSSSEFSDHVSGSFVCPIPQNLAIENTGCGFIKINWQDFPSNIIESGYNIYRSTDGEFGEYQNIGSVNANVLSFVDANSVYQDRTYFYRITARFSNTYSAFSNYVSASSTCIVPSNLRITNTNCGSISLAWSDYPIGTTETGYEIYRSESENGSYNRLDGIFANITNYTDNGNDIAAGKTYYYKLKGVFNNISTNFSNVAFGSFDCNFNQCISLKSGQWNDPTTWSCGRIPTTLDEILINNGHSVTIGNNLNANAKNITNNGEIIFGENAFLILNTP
jgi:hypothetical protein